MSAMSAQARGAKGSGAKARAHNAARDANSRLRRRPGPWDRRWQRFYTGLRRDLERYQPLVMFCVLSLVLLVAYGLWASGAVARTGTIAVGLGHDVLGAAGLRVAQVSVEGRERLSESQVLQALRAEQGMMLFDFDTHAARDRIEALPWVQSADVMRLLPDRLHVRIMERAPFAIWQTGGQFLLIGADGVVMEKLVADNIGDYAHLPQVVGEGANEHAADLIAALAEAPGLRSRLKAASRVGNRRWNLRLDNGIDVRLPDTDVERAIREIAALDSDYRLLMRDIAVIDLRLPDQIIVKPTGDGTRAADEPWQARFRLMDED